MFPETGCGVSVLMGSLYSNTPWGGGVGHGRYSSVRRLRAQSLASFTVYEEGSNRHAEHWARAGFRNSVNR